jgi:hypothetical protein
MKKAQIEVVRKLTDPSGAVRLKSLNVVCKSSVKLFVTIDDFRLLFESLFRTLWLADSKLQKDTINGISSIVEHIRNSKADVIADYLSVFWEVLDKNWASIDRYRLNKYYLLVETVFCTLSSEERLLCSEFTLNHLSISRKPSGLLMRLAELSISQIGNTNVSTHLRESFCINVAKMISQFSCSKTFEPAIESISKFAVAEISFQPIIKKEIIELLGSKNLPGNSRAILKSILELTSIPPA